MDAAVATTPPQAPLAAPVAPRMAVALLPAAHADEEAAAVATPTTTTTTMEITAMEGITTITILLRLRLPAATMAEDVITAAAIATTTLPPLLPPRPLEVVMGVAMAVATTKSLLFK